MKVALLVLATLLLAPAAPAIAQGAPGKLSGGKAYSLPQWFKPSFLDFREDAAEAGKRGRHVMLFLHMDDCPYCERMLSESFSGGDITAFMRKHFDVVAVNVRGGLEVVWVDGARHTERSLARHLKVFGTPTLVFLGADGKVALQLGGYRDPQSLRHALEFVQSRSYRNQSLAAYLESRDKRDGYVFRSHPQFATVTDFRGYRKPLAILWEDRRCADCARFHDRTLGRPDVMAEMKAFLFVRLDASSREPVVDLEGNATTPAQWARALGLTYRPAVVLFDGGREIFRMDSLLYHFHFRETLRYVSGGHYKRYATISEYHAARREELLKQGVSIDYGE